MSKIYLNDLQRFAAYNLAVLWGDEKKAGGSHARRIQRIVERFDIDGLEESDRKNREKPETERHTYSPNDKAQGYELDEADLEFYRSLMREYFDKNEGLPAYFRNASSNWRVVLGLMEAVEKVYQDQAENPKAA